MTTPLAALSAICDPRDPLRGRPLVADADAFRMASLFKLLGSPTRLRLLHALERADELCVTDLAAEVEMSPQAVSNQLQRLVDRGILGSQREGNKVFYRVVDPCLSILLELAICLSHEADARQAARL